MTKPYIDTIRGRAYFVKTCTEDKRGGWDDHWSTMAGEFVIHEDKKHYVYSLDRKYKNIKDIKLKLANGFSVIGPESNKVEAQKLVRKINTEMKLAYKEYICEGESRAMDERDDVFHEYASRLKKLGYVLVA